MCGIVGIYSTHSKDRTPEILNKMKDAIRHRGPDDEGSYFDGPVALGHRRLSIIDLSTGKQPISNQEQTLTTVFNGEIYNFQSIREGLKEYSFQTHTDTEVLVHLYDQKKEKMLDDLNGMFAFAIWDKKQNELFIARDRLGIKPLYYYFKDGLFLFASEIKALLKHPQVSHDLSFQAISQYFAYDYVPAPLTIYQNIFKLPAGHSLTIKNNQMEIKKYWELPVPKASNLSYGDAKQQLKEKLTASIKQMLIADVPLGIFLSGGIDSTLITQLAVQDLGIRPNTFSIGFEDKSFDESFFAQSAAEHFKTQHHHQVFSAKELLNLLPEVISKMDEPFADPSLLPTYLLSQFASKNVKVVLGGDGGDEVFIGYPTYLAHRYAKQFKLGWDLAAPLLSQLIHYLPVSHNNLSLDFKIKSFLRGYQDKSPYRHIIWTGGFSPSELKQLLRDPEQTTTPVQIPELNQIADIVRKFSYLDTKLYLQDDILKKLDSATMMASIEGRVPYLDHTVVEFASTIPTDYLLKGSTTKYILRDLLDPALQNTIIKRPKKGFGIPVSKWINTELKAEFDQVFSEQNLKNIEFFDYRFIQKLLKEHRSLKFDHRKRLWSLFIFLRWLQKV